MMEQQLTREYREKWFRMILKIKDKGINFNLVCCNSNLTSEIILNNSNEKWNWLILGNPHQKYNPYLPSYEHEIVFEYFANNDVTKNMICMKHDLYEKNKLLTITTDEILEQMKY